MGQYLPIILLAVLAVVFGAVSIFVSHLLAPKKSNPIKESPYECGVDPVVETPERFPVKFFLIAMIFIVFDVEIIFLYPWAVAHGSLGVVGLVAILIFSFAVFESFLYLVSKGVFNWNSVKIGLTSRLQKSQAEASSLKDSVLLGNTKFGMSSNGSNNDTESIRRVSSKDKGIVEVAK